MSRLGPDPARPGRNLRSPALPRLTLLIPSVYHSDIKLRKVTATSGGGIPAARPDRWHASREAVMGAPGTAVAGRLDVRADRLQVPARRPEQATGRPAVEIAHLRKTYGPLVAVDDVSLSVAEGEIFGILGPNGAGKTTTVECAIGLRSPDSGTIRLLGLDPQADRDEVHEIVGRAAAGERDAGQARVGRDPRHVPVVLPRPGRRRRADRGARAGGQARTTTTSPCPAASGSGCRSRWRSSAGRRSRCSTR